MSLAMSERTGAGVATDANPALIALYQALIYCDPPYAGTTSYGATGAFDYPRFYTKVREWSCYTDVFVSEYRMPGEPIMEFTHDMSVAGGVQKDARTERLYHYAPDRAGPLLWL